MKQVDTNITYMVDRDRWAKMSIFDQMGNISSEVGRSFIARRHDNDVDCMLAVERAIELFDATIMALIANKSPKSREVLRAKESYLNSIFGDTYQPENDASLERYFMQFAVASRLKRFN